MNRVLRFMPLVVVAAAAVVFGASGASGGNGATVLQGTFHTLIVFDVDGSPTVFLPRATRTGCRSPTAAQRSR
jgi:hypothetical protein